MWGHDAAADLRVLLKTGWMWDWWSGPLWQTAIWCDKSLSNVEAKHVTATFTQSVIVVSRLAAALAGNARPVLHQSWTNVSDVGPGLRQYWTRPSWTLPSFVRPLTIWLKCPSEKTLRKINAISVFYLQTHTWIVCRKWRNIANSVSRPDIRHWTND